MEGGAVAKTFGGGGALEACDESVEGRAAAVMASSSLDEDDELIAKSMILRLCIAKEMMRERPFLSENSLVG